MLLKRKTNKFLIITAVILLIGVIFLPEIQAQCPMCRMSAESNLREGGTAGKGLNKGILYMLSLPYLLVATLGYIWWRNRRKLDDDIYSEPFSEN